MKLKNQNDKTLWFKFGESVMEHVVIFLCNEWMNAITNCFVSSHSYDMIFTTQFF